MIQTQTMTANDIFQSILDLVKSDAKGSRDYRRFELEALHRHCAEGMESDSAKFLGSLFINALNNRFFGSGNMENIYDRQYEVSQIRLFDILINKFPFVKYSQEIINEAIVNAMTGHTEIMLIDIGTGLGTQMINVLEAARNIDGLMKVIVVGIEPFGDALKQARIRMDELKASLPFELIFVPVKEYVEQVDFRKFAGMCSNIIVNASLALHHIQNSADRNAVIARIKSIKPLAFMLIEPNVNHFEPVLEKRFHNCYHHFYSLFRLIDTLDISIDEKSALKLFFGREIEDILGKEEKDRFEKHEPARMFIGRLLRSNFTVRPEMMRIPATNVSGVSISQNKDGFVGFTYENETALALICAN